jgi:pyruvate-formate lyase
MLTGVVLDFKEFTGNDEPGVRLKVFMKGCRLRRSWCHNPEGLLSCQQLQINTFNPDILRDATQHPEGRRNLVVRAWGWNGCFCELNEVYQDQIISRDFYGT